MTKPARTTAPQQTTQTEGLTVPERVAAAIAEYRQGGDVFGNFCADVLVTAEGNRLKTAVLYQRYVPWVKANGYKPLCIQDFVAERRRYELGSNGRIGNFIVDFDIRGQPPNETGYSCQTAEKINASENIYAMYTIFTNLYRLKNLCSCSLECLG